MAASRRFPIDTSGPWRFEPATTGNWPALTRLFGARGACAGCWCMYWRRPRTAFERGKGEGNRRALKALVEGDRPPGILAFEGDDPVAWCAVAPRSDFPVLQRSRILEPAVEEPGTWAVPCLFIRRSHRRRGLSSHLLQGAARFAASFGAGTLEGYPVDVTKPWGDAFLWTGVASAFRRAGFSEVLRRSPKRPIMRLSLGDNGAA
jgi:GNAT superfamily N-acetyltransferase